MRCIGLTEPSPRALRRYLGPASLGTFNRYQNGTNLPSKRPVQTDVVRINTKHQVT